jgi:hypothetical protein
MPPTVRVTGTSHESDTPPDMPGPLSYYVAPGKFSWQVSVAKLNSNVMRPEFRVRRVTASVSDSLYEILGRGL